MGVFPIRNGGASKVCGTLSPTTVPRGTDVTLRHFTVENLSSVFDFEGAAYRVVLEHTTSNAAIEIGGFSWRRFGPFGQRSGDLAFTVPSDTPPASCRVVAIFRGDADATNDRAVFGTIRVR
jgi:hypothetical protein